MVFLDRIDAGERLGTRLAHLRGEPLVVLGLPRGGVPVAYEVARALGAPLDVIVVRKLGVPHQPELGMGAIGEDGVRVVNPDVVRLARVSDDELSAVEAGERVELDRRAHRFRAGRSRIPLEGRTAVIVDDGIATGSTARAACLVAHAQGAERVVLAVPVAPEGWESRLSDVADELISLETPAWFQAVGQFYADFSQTSDDEVVDCLERARVELIADRTDGQVVDPPTRDLDVEVATGRVTLAGHLRVPEHARGVVIFAHGSGSSRHSPRNRFVADVLHEAGIGTLLFDLLTPAEELDRANVFDVELLARRLLDVTGWLRHEDDLGRLGIGYFGASTGAAAALWAAAEPDAGIGAVVSRGGRPDLAMPRLARVTAPTLLVVGGRDEAVLDLNRMALAELRCESRLEIVVGATHLFEEPGTLAAAARLASDWFVAHLGPLG